MTTTLLRHTTNLVVTSCWCGIALAIPDSLDKLARHNGKTLYCPLGHTFVYSETEADRMKKELEKAKQALENQKRITKDWANDYHDISTRLSNTKRSLSATKGALTRTKQRIQVGLCPCCRKTFKALGKHMQLKHPDYATTDEPGTEETGAGQPTTRLPEHPEA